MTATFPGFSPQTLTFFRQLAKNNKREWFQPRKEKFEEWAREPMLELLALVADDFRKHAVEYAVEPKKALYRIYRDTRFAKDKTPYKTHIAAMFFRPDVSKNNGAGFYFSVSHETVEIAGGMYMPGPAELLAVRNAIAADNGKAFRKLITSPALRKHGGKLLGDCAARVPAGFDPEHPAADLLRHKQFYFDVTLPPTVATTPKLFKEITTRFRAMTPVVEYINNAVRAAARDEDTGPAIPKRPAPMF